MNTVTHIANICGVQPIDVNDWLVKVGLQVESGARQPRYVLTQEGIKYGQRRHVGFDEWLVWDDKVLTEARRALSPPSREEFEALRAKVSELASLVAASKGMEALCRANLRPDLATCKIQIDGLRPDKMDPDFF